MDDQTRPIQSFSRDEIQRAMAQQRVAILEAVSAEWVAQGAKHDAAIAELAAMVRQDLLRLYEVINPIKAVSAYGVERLETCGFPWPMTGLVPAPQDSDLEIPEPSERVYKEPTEFQTLNGADFARHPERRPGHKIPGWLSDRTTDAFLLYTATGADLDRFMKGARPAGQTDAETRADLLSQPMYENTTSETVTDLRAKFVKNWLSPEDMQRAVDELETVQPTASQIHAACEAYGKMSTSVPPLQVVEGILRAALNV